MTQFLRLEGYTHKVGAPIPLVELTLTSTGRPYHHAYQVRTVAVTQNSVREVNIYLSEQQMLELAEAIWQEFSQDEITPDHPISDDEYIASTDNLCPACRGNDVDYEGIEAEDEGVVCDAYCGTCGATWTETYDLVGYCNLRRPKEA